MGHGASPSPEYERFPEAWSLHAAAVRIENILKMLGIARAHIVGYSLGARTALTYALGFPQRIATLSLLSANPGIEDTAMRSSRASQDAQLAENILAGGLARFVQSWSSAPLFAAQQPSHPSAWLQARSERRRGCARGFAASLRGSGQGAQESLWDQLGQLSCPVLTAGGMLDAAYVAIARRIAADTAAELCLFEDCGHDIPLEQPIALAKEVLAFWARAESR
jgi:2-succinyl-6-hydroxy-2,4-cyclohexadiene-1-carboxylate synthase